MKFLFQIWICASSVFASQVLAVQDEGDQRAHHVSTSVNFKVPKSWQKSAEAGYHHTDALFGVPFQRNRAIIGSLFYMTPDFFEAADAKKAGCDEYSVELTYKELAMDKIFLVDRGSCSFTQKSALAQSKGAQALVVANNQCIQSDIDYFTNKAKFSKEQLEQVCCYMKFDGDGFPIECQTEKEYLPQYLPFMSADGPGNSLSIFIPAVMLKLSDAFKAKVCLCKIRDELKSSKFCNDFKNILDQDKELKCDADVIMEIKVDTPQANGNVNFELWMKPDAQPSFLSEFEWFAKEIVREQSKATFTPSYIVHEPIKCLDNDADSGDDMCDLFCIDLNKEGEEDSYENICYLPESDNYDLSGRDVLREIVRQTCLVELDKDKHLPLWWKYQKAFKEQACIQSPDLRDCSMSIVETLPKLDQNGFRRCEHDDEKRILRELNNKQKSMGIFTTAMIVNSRVMHFSLEPETIAKRVCEGFTESSTPGICECVGKASNDVDYQLCSEDKGKIPSASHLSKSATNGSLLVVLVFSLLFGSVAFLYAFMTKRRMRRDMEEIMRSYMPLDETLMGDENDNQESLI